MSFKLKSQTILSSLCLSAGFALLSMRKPVNEFVSKPVLSTLRSGGGNNDERRLGQFSLKLEF